MPDWTILITVGIILIILGFFLVISGITGSFKENNKKEYRVEESDGNFNQKKVKGGGVILIGPIPIVFDSDKKYAILAMVLAIIIMVLSILFIK